MPVTETADPWFLRLALSSTAEMWRRSALDWESDPNSLLLLLFNVAGLSLFDKFPKDGPTPPLSPFFEDLVGDRVDGVLSSQRSLILNGDLR